MNPLDLHLVVQLSGIGVNSHTPAHSLLEPVWENAAAAALHLHTGFLNPSAPGPARLHNQMMSTAAWFKCFCKLIRAQGAGIFVPDSILLRIFRAHWTKASSTFSPVRALVSKNMSSESKDIHVNNIHWTHSQKNNIQDCDYIAKYSVIIFIQYYIL